MRVALYGRVSTTDKGQEVDNQLLQLREHAASNKWTIVKEYVDRKTGATGDRPEFKLMFEAAYQRKFDLVLFWSLDRFSREGTLKTLQYLQTLRQYNVAYRSLKEQYIDSLGPFADVVISLIATIAEMERKRFGERVKAGMARRKAKGQWIGRKKKIFDVVKGLERRKEGASFAVIAKEQGVSVGVAFSRLQEYEKARVSDW